MASIVCSRFLRCVFCLLLFAAFDAVGGNRLPEIVTPVHYRLTLLPIIETSPRICGHVWIDVTARMTTSIIMLHAAGEMAVLRTIVIPGPSTIDANVTQATPTNEIVDDVRLVEDFCFHSMIQISELADNIVIDVAQDGQKEQLTIVLQQPLEKGANYRIGILYQANVYESINQGFFRSFYQPNDTECCKRPIGATQLEATHASTNPMVPNALAIVSVSLTARKLFPCIDEPDKKTSFQLMIGHMQTVKALSNMPSLWSIPMFSIENWQWDVFDTTPVMSTYLVAIVLTEFTHLETSYKSIDGHDVHIRLWSRQQYLYQLEFALSLVPKALAKLENYLQVPYTLPKLDLISVPGFESGKAMENWGLIIHSEDNLLVDETLETWDVALIAVTIIHELAHQWVGNLVTTRSWDDIWVTEGLTTLFEDIVLQDVAPALEGEVIMVVFLQEVLKTDLLFGTNPLNAPTDAYTHVDDKFDSISYAKGAAIMRMARSFVGEKAFRNAVQRYIQLNKFGTSNSSDFWTLINQEGRRSYTISGRMSVARVMKTWTHQAGYPVVHVHRTDHGYIHLSQRPFKHESLKNKTDIKSYVSTASWFIPILSTDAESMEFRADTLIPTITWLTPKKPSVEIPGPKSKDSWIIINPQSNGYYRVNYDRHNWQLIADQLKKNFSAIPFVTRAQLVDDAFSLAHARIIPYEIPTKLVKYLDTSDESSFIRKLVKVHVEQIETTAGNHIHVRDEEIVDEIMSCVTREHSYNTLARSGRNLNKVLIDGNCEAGEQLCSNQALRLYRKLMNNTLNSNEKELIDIHFDSIWCAALRDGGKDEWEFAWKTVNDLHDIQQSRRRKLLKAMACSTNPVRNKQLVSRLFDPNINQTPKETTEIVLRLAENAKARQLALSFLLANWNMLSKHFENPKHLWNLLKAVMKNSFTVEDLGKVKAFVTQRSGEVDERTATQILASIKKSLIWSAEGDDNLSMNSSVENTTLIKY